MGKLLLAVVFIVIFSFCFVFSFDNNNTSKARIILGAIAATSAIITLILIYYIMKNPY